MGAGDGEPAVGRSIGPFKLEAVLGEGGMGVVYRAVREGSGETVALKVLKRALSGDDVFRRRFDREARIAGQLEHRHLVPVLEHGELDGVPYLAMRYVDGMSLDARIKDGLLPLEETIRIISEIASGLDSLHREGLVHRDVKPANVLIDGDMSASLTDYGLARGMAYTVLTRPGEVMGTLDYLAPELISGNEASPASDVYALGCTAYECFTGAAPCAGVSIFEVATSHIDEEPPDPREARPELPPDLAWALVQAMVKDPARRPTTALAYATMLQAAAPR